MTFSKDIEEQEGLVRRLRTQKERDWKRLEDMHEHYTRVNNMLNEEEQRLHQMRNPN